MTYSIIIATFNAGQFLENALESLISIEHDSYELIVIDGGSNDSTVEIIKKYEKHISYWISEKDRGIYDAWNKGITQAKGDWILFLGADDTLLPKSLKDYDTFLSTRSDANDLEYVSSRMSMVDLDGNKIRVKGWAWEWPKFLKETTVAHPGSLHSQRLFKKYGLFNPNYRSAGDFELLVRAKSELKFAFLNKITVVMQEGGISDGVIGIKEHCQAAIATGGYNPILAYNNALWVYTKYTIRKTLRKVGINAYLKR